MKKIFTLSVIFASLFACSEQESSNSVASSTTKSVTLTISQSSATKGVESQKEDGEYAVIASATVFFLNDSDEYILQRDLTSDEVATVANTSTTSGDKTIEIDGVPSNATSLQFIANVKTSAQPDFPELEGSSLEDTRLRIDMLQNSSENTPMSGISEDFTEDTDNDGYYTTSVSLTPMVARIEIGEVDYSSSSSDMDLTGFTLSGVFINNARPYVLATGDPDTDEMTVDIRSQSTWSTDATSFFESTNTAFPYVTGGSDTPSDWTASSLVTFCSPTGDTALTFYPDATDGSTTTEPSDDLAWAYNVVPSESVTGDDIASDIPHVILKLTGVTYESRPYADDEQYVTVTQYNDASGNAIQQFEKGNVYKIESLQFGYQQATDEPYSDNIIVTVTVSVTPWVINTVTPSWND